MRGMVFWRLVVESVCQLEFDLGNMLLSWVLGLFFLLVVFLLNAILMKMVHSILEKWKLLRKDFLVGECPDHRRLLVVIVLRCMLLFHLCKFLTGT